MEILRGIRAELVAFRTELKGEMTALRTELKAEIAETHSELKAEIAATNERLDRTNDHLIVLDAAVAGVSKDMRTLTAEVREIKTYVLDVQRETILDLRERVTRLEHKVG